ncbi:MAG: type IX secretion system sortase PorU [Bacteroidia bacterium]|nr:type IX secretion system sortase PorU [Bacteroidia bacterium]
MKKTVFVFLWLLSCSLLKAQTNTSVLVTGNWYKMVVSETGIYKLTYNDLVSMGVNVNTINPKNIRIYANGAGMLPLLNNQARPDDLIENAIRVVGEDDNVFNVNDYILFYGQSPVTWHLTQDSSGFEHEVNLYSDYTYYFLNTDIGPGKRIQTRQSLTTTPTHNVITFDDYMYHENEFYNFIKSGKDWYGEKFDTTLTYNFLFYFPDLDISSPVKLYTKVAARSNPSSSFSFYVNSQNILNVSVNAVNMSNNTASYAAIATGSANFIFPANTILLSVNYNKSNSASIGWLDHIILNIRRNFFMTNPQMSFRDRLSVGSGNISQFTLMNVSSTIEIWDVTNSVNTIQQLPREPVSNSQFIFEAATDSLREFIAFDNDSFLTPQFVLPVANQNLHGLSGANMLIVAPGSFVNEANQLADHHRNHDNLTVHVVTTDQIYNEFSSGAQDISAIRDFAKMLYIKGQGTADSLKYILLFGDASYDYKNRIVNNTNLVPTFESVNSMDPTQSFVSDDFFTLFDSTEGTVNGIETMDIGVGRLPVKTQAEAQTVVNKIIHYATSAATMKSWRTDICFVADDAEDVTAHEHQADDLASKVDTTYPCYNINKIYLDDYVQVGDTCYPSVNAAINQQVEKGALIINYTGHGNESGWAHEHVLTLPMIQAWTNYDNLPFFYTATTLFGRFDNPDFCSGGEEVLLNTVGGGIGIIAPARLTYSSPNYSLNLYFYNQIFSLDQNGRHYRLGDIIKVIKNSQTAINKRNFNLLGDPAVMLAYPKYEVITTQVNGTNVQNLLDTLYPGNSLTIAGFVADNSGLIMNSFNGNIHYRLYDKERIDSTLGNDGNPPLIFQRQDSILLEGDADVLNGMFEIQFTVPATISPGYGHPKFSYYATDNMEDAMGCFEDLIVYGYIAGITEYKAGDMQIKVYPTITSDKIFCEFGNTMNSQIDVQIYNTAGETIYKCKATQAENTVLPIDVAKLNRGLYMIRLTSGNASVTKKFIRE